MVHSTINKRKRLDKHDQEEICHSLCWLFVWPFCLFALQQKAPLASVMFPSMDQLRLLWQVANPTHILMFLIFPGILIGEMLTVPTMVAKSWLNKALLFVVVAGRRLLPVLCPIDTQSRRKAAWESTWPHSSWSTLTQRNYLHIFSFFTFIWIFVFHFFSPFSIM